MPILHIVLFEFNPRIPKAQVDDVCNRMVALAQQCVHPETSQPYVKCLGGGRDNSPEGLQGAFTHGFIMEFASAEDRTYYVERDPAHLAFVAHLKETDVLQNARVVDFEPGVF